jgi:RnfABCDGE-type electron transport complex B subunit
MNWVTIGLSAGTLVSLAVIFSYILGWANKAFEVATDPRVEEVMDALPGANCGGCGFIGCYEYAEAVVFADADVSRCTVGGQNVAKALAAIMGVSVEQRFPYRPVVHCAAHSADRLKQSDYQGEKKCIAANLVSGIQGCTYGCLGLGDCENACDFDAIHVEDGLAVVDYDACIGCGACAKACPRHIISIVPFKFDRILAVTCANKDFGKDVKEVCTVGCIGCKACERVADLVTIRENLPVIDYDRYDVEYLPDMVKAVEKCPRKGILFIGKPSPEDMAAVKDEALPDIVKPDFQTTVDKTQWQG